MPQAVLPHGIVKQKHFMEQWRGAWWRPVAVLAALCWAAPPEGSWSPVLCSGDRGQSAPFTFHVTCAQKLCLEEAGAHLVASRASQHAPFYYKDFSKFIKMGLI